MPCIDICGKLVCQFIDLAFPDPSDTGAGYAEYSRFAIRWSVASLIVAFPVFLYVSRLLRQAIRRDPSKRDSKVRKWLTYITLFVAAGVIIGDLTSLVFNFLGSELTVHFVLKVLAVGVMAGTIFGYYLWDLRQEESEAQM